MNIKRALSGIFLSILFAGFFSFLIYSSQSFVGQNSSFLGSVSGAQQSLDSGSEPKQQLAQQEVQLPPPDVNADAAISVESNLSDADKVLLQKNSESKLPIASLTKLMTAVVVLDKYNLTDSITVSSIADSQSPMQTDLKSGETMPVESFLHIMLIESSNKAAYALSEKIGEPNFVALMNQKAKEIGMANTFFVDPTGLGSQDISTAKDLTVLAEYILKSYPKITEISRIKEYDLPNFGHLENTDELLGEVPDVVCSKTGFTNEAMGCLLLVVNNPKNNDYLINVVLGAQDRFSEMEKIINWSNIVCK